MYCYRIHSICLSNVCPWYNVARNPIICRLLGSVSDHTVSINVSYIFHFINVIQIFDSRFHHQYRPIAKGSNRLIDIYSLSLAVPHAKLTYICIAPIVLVCEIE